MATNRISEARTLSMDELDIVSGGEHPVIAARRIELATRKLMEAAAQSVAIMQAQQAQSDAKSAIIRNIR